MKTKLVQKLNTLLETEKISRAQIARSVGISSAQLSLFLKGDYNMAPETMSKLSKYADNYSKTKSSSQEKEPFVMTKQAKSIFFICDECVIEGEMGIVYGHPGTGKTTALKNYAQQNPQAVFIEVEPGITPRELLWSIADTIGAERDRSRVQTERNICKRLKLRDAVIIIDEGEHLRVDSLDDLRRIWDFSKTPLILSGTEILLRKLMGTKGELAQLYDRIGLKWKTTTINSDELALICDAYGIDSSVSPFIQKTVDGNLRKAAKLIKRAKRLAKLSGSEVNKELLEEATRMLIL